MTFPATRIASILGQTKYNTWLFFSQLDGDGEERKQHPTYHVTRTTATMAPDTFLASVESSRLCRPAPALLPFIKDLEAKISHHFFISDSQYDIRPRAYRLRSFRFLELPAEVREKIYEFIWGIELRYYFSIRLCYPSVSIRRLHDRGLRFRRGIALLLVNKQVSREAAHVVYSQTPLRIESAPYRKPENLNFIGSVRTTWFTSTTRFVRIRSNFDFEAERNAAWVKGLNCFQALLSLEVLLDLATSLEKPRSPDLISNLLPFAALKCETITFRAPPHVPEDAQKEVQDAWQEALNAEKLNVVAVVCVMGSRDLQCLANGLNRLESFGIMSPNDQGPWKSRSNE